MLVQTARTELVAKIELVARTGVNITEVANRNFNEYNLMNRIQLVARMS